MTSSFDDLHCQYAWASGTSYQDCAFIGRRWRDAYGTTLSDSDFYVLGNGPSPATGSQTLQFWGPWPNMMTCLWRDLPSGRVYAGDASQGSVHIWDDIMKPDQPARVEKLGFSPEGMWGLDEEHLYAWGVKRIGPGDQQPHLVQFDGKAWKELPHPGFFIVQMHGLAPDFLYAAGRGGGLARWNGREWTVFPMPTGEHLSDVYVAGPDEMYATGLNGSLLEGTANGWTTIARAIDDRLPYACVIKFADQLLVGGAFQGLFRRVGKSNKLELHKKSVTATHFEARAGSLIATCGLAIAGSTDGEDFQGSAMNDLCETTKMIDIEPR